MNVEIGAEAALFPEKEYISAWDFRCSACRDLKMVAGAFYFYLRLCSCRLSSLTNSLPDR
jgi:hypothetical protein